MSMYFGTGSGLIGLRETEPGVYWAMRWVTVLYLPVYPLETLRVRPQTKEFEYRAAFYGHSYKYQVLERYPNRGSDILRMYLISLCGLIFALTPMIAWLYAFEPWNRQGQDQFSESVGIITVVWIMGVAVFVDHRRNRVFKLPPD